MPDSGGTWLLPRLIGGARARGLAMRGDKRPAEEAGRIGLIWRCVGDEQLGAEVQALAQRLAAMPGTARVATRMTLAAGPRSSLAEALAAEGRRQGALAGAADYREGVAAFLAKRAPRFTDR